MKKLIQTAGYGRIVSTQSSAKQRNYQYVNVLIMKDFIRFEDFSDYYREHSQKEFAVMILRPHCKNLPIT